MQSYTTYILILICSCGIFRDAPAYNDMLIYWDEQAQSKTPVLPDDILSNIEFVYKDPPHPIVHYADLSVADPIGVCPLDTFPTDLKKVARDLLLKLRESTQKIKDIRSSSCGILQDRIKATESQVGDALRFQFAANAAIPAAANQNAINAYTRKASAVNQIVALTSDMFQSGCITEADDKTVIQKLVGQALTISGLFAGGWEGIGIAAFGQIFANIPLHLDQLENTIRDIRIYDEQNEGATFLCWFRQILQTSALMFATSRDHVINGLDLTFETGPAHTTKETLEQLEREESSLVHDVKMLSEITATSNDILETLTLMESSRSAPFLVVKKVKAWCEKNHYANPFEGLLYEPASHPRAVDQAMYSLRTFCDDLISLRWPQSAQMNNYLDEVYRVFLTLSEYYRSINQPGERTVMKIAETVESMKFFEKTRKMMSEFRDGSAGNQMRIHFRELTERVSSHYATRAFKDIMKRNMVRFKSGTGDKRRSLKALISACQTFDPTLTSFGVDNPKTNKLLKLWARKCVGPASEVCSHVIEKKDEHTLLEIRDPKDRPYRVYFYSLCGHWKPFPPTSPF